MSGPLSGSALLEAAREGDSAACEQVLLENNGLIWSVVRRYYGRGVEPDDLYQLGCLGFLKAVQGENRRVRRADGPVKVSRGLKERGTGIRAARARLSASLGREPTLSELAEDTGLSPEDIAAAETAIEPVVSLQAETGEDGLTLEGMLTVGNEEEGMVERLALRSAISALPEREQQVLLLRYYRGLTQTDTARVIGVSQVQVSRLERRALDRLRQELM